MIRTCRDCSRKAERWSPYCADHINRHAAAAFASESKPVWVQRLSKNAKVLTP